MTAPATGPSFRAAKNKYERRYWGGRLSARPWDGAFDGNPSETGEEQTFLLRKWGRGGRIGVWPGGGPESDRPPYGGLLFLRVDGVEFVQILAGLFDQSECIKTGLNQSFVVR